MDELWNRFLESGSISDYLKYKSFEQSGEKNSDDIKRAGFKGEKPRG